TVLTGEVAGNEGDDDVVTTGIGTLAGRANGALSGKSRVSLVVPAEAIEVHAADRRETLGRTRNLVDARIERSEVVGHIAHLTARLQDGRAVALEAHVDKYR